MFTTQSILTTPPPPPPPPTRLMEERPPLCAIADRITTCSSHEEHNVHIPLRIRSKNIKIWVTLKISTCIMGNKLLRTSYMTTVQVSDILYYFLFVIIQNLSMMQKLLIVFWAIKCYEKEIAPFKLNSCKNRDFNLVVQCFY